MYLEERLDLEESIHQRRAKLWQGGNQYINIIGCTSQSMKYFAFSDRPSETKTWIPLHKLVAFWIVSILKSNNTFKSLVQTMFHKKVWLKARNNYLHIEFFV